MVRVCVRVCVRLCVTVCAVLGAALALPAAANPYAEHSDEELTRVASEWEALSTEERRDFFLEIRRRMAVSGRKQSMPVEVRRRFGRTVRGPDGSVLRIEQVIRYRAPGTEVSSADGPDDYGKGFEQRAEEAAEPDERPAPPVVKVNKTVDSD